MLPSTSATFVVRTLCVRARRTRRPPQNLRQQPFLSALDGVHPTPLLSQRPISTPGSHVKNLLLFQSLTVRMDGEMVRWDDGTKQLYAGTMFDWSGRLLECVRSLFATSLPLLTAANFCNHQPCPPSPVSLKLCINAICNDTSPMTNNLIAKNYNNNNNNHILQLIIFSLGERQGCYWQTVPPQWEGGRLFDRSAGFFYGNSCNFGTESRKIIPKVGN